MGLMTHFTPAVKQNMILPWIYMEKKRITEQKK